MKRIFLALLAIVLTLSVMPTAAQQGVTYYVNVKAAKVRSEATTTSKLVTTLGRGKPVVVVEIVTGEKVSNVDTWYRVNASGTEGYILSSLLTDRAPIVTNSSTNGSSGNSSSTNNSSTSTQAIAPTAAPAPSSNTVSAGNGATALCNDGTYSYAAHHQGACSHHGGVSVFYK